MMIVINDSYLQALKRSRQHSNDKYKNKYPDTFFHGEPSVEFGNDKLNETPFRDLLIV